MSQTETSEAIATGLLVLSGDLVRCRPILREKCHSERGKITFKTSCILELKPPTVYTKETVSLVYTKDFSIL